MKPPIQAPTIAGAPAISASAPSRGEVPPGRRSAIGAAMPSPSVMLCTMNPTIRNVPSASSPSAIDEPIARPSPRLCSPIPIARRASRGPRPRAARSARAGRRPRSAARRTSGRGSWPRRRAGSGRGPWKPLGRCRLEVERLAERVEREEAEQPGGERHEGGDPARVGASERGQPARARAPPGRSRPGGRSARSRGIRVAMRRASRPRPARRRSSRSRSSSSRRPCTGRPRPTGYGTTIVLERSRPSVGGPSTPEGHDRVVDGHAARSSALCRCGFVTRILISPGLNSTRRMSNSSRGRGRPPDEVEQRGAGSTRTPPRRRRAAGAARAPRAASAAKWSPGGSRGRRFHQSTTSKKPIQPSSVNSDWWAWNMNLPGVREVDLDDPALALAEHAPVSVYSKWSLEPVG